MLRLKRFFHYRPLFYYALTVILCLLYGYLMLRPAVSPKGYFQPMGGDEYLVRAPGYRDRIAFLIKKDRAGRYSRFELLESSEDPLFASEEDIRRYLSRFVGATPETAADVDGISGATVTSQAIRDALRSGMPGIDWPRTILISALWGLTVLLSFLRKRVLLLVASVFWFAVIGVMNNTPVMAYSFLRPAAGLGVLPLLAVTGALLFRNVYCRHICPFGFLQRLLAWIPLKIHLRFLPVLKAGKYFLLSVVIASAAVGSRLYLAPYAYLFSRKLIWWLYLFPASMLLASIFIPRFWCRGFCPVGAVLEIGKKARHWGLKGKTMRIGISTGIASAGTTREVLLILFVFGIILLSNILLVL